VGKDIPVMIGVMLILCIIVIMFTGCLENSSNESRMITHQDQPCTLPDWNDGFYHDYYGTTQTLYNYNAKYPNLVNVFSIGKSVLGKDIWCIKITNEDNNTHKFSCLIDGCIHGDEWESGETCLYLAEYLLINFHTNATIKDILNNTEVYIVPMLNPDGRTANERFTDNGVDPNRNFDIFFGKLLRGHSLRIGKLFGKIKIPVVKLFSNDPFKYYWNCGRQAFSEPETQAIRDLMKTLNHHDFSFYVNCHTSLHMVATPWISFRPPFEMTQQEKDTFDSIVDWTKENTEYDASRGEGFKYKTGGNAMDWCFKEFRIPSFTYEILSLDYLSGDYDPMAGTGKHDHLVHWMKTTLPFFMYLLVNSENLNNWEIPDVEPLLPKGVPPAPLQ
jgi:carboxypeptidase T